MELTSERRERATMLRALAIVAGDNSRSREIHRARICELAAALGGHADSPACREGSSTNGLCTQEQHGGRPCETIRWVALTSVLVMCSSRYSGGRHADEVMRLGERGVRRDGYRPIRRNAGGRLCGKGEMIGPKAERSLESLLLLGVAAPDATRPLRVLWRVQGVLFGSDGRTRAKRDACARPGKDCILHLYLPPGGWA